MISVIGSRGASSVASSPDDATVPLRRIEIVGGIGLGILFLLPLLYYGPWDAEMVWATIFPNQLHYQALSRGEWLFWLNDLGFGTPLPIGDPLTFHPVFGPFAALASLRATFTAVWLVHTVVMVVYFLRLAAVSGISPPLRFVLLAFYLGSVVSMTYFYDTDWLNFMIAWSLYPVLVFYLRSAVLGEAVTRFWPTTLRLALLFGFWINNAHPGHIAPLVTVLTIYALAAAPRRRYVYACLGLGALFCLAITAEHIHTLVHEASLFPPGTEFTRNGSTLTAYVEHALNTVPRSRRAPFIGLGLGLAAVASVVRLATLRDPHVRACAVAFVAAVTLSLLPPSFSQWFAPSGTWLLRDVMVFFGLLAGGNILQRGLGSPHLWRRGAALALILIQAVQQGAVVTWPSLEEFLQYRGRLLFYRYQGRAVGLGRGTGATRGEVWATRISVSTGGGRHARPSFPRRHPFLIRPGVSWLEPHKRLVQERFDGSPVSSRVPYGELHQRR